MSDFDANVFDVNEVKTLDETDRKCPCCGGTMNYDPATKSMHCPFCEHTEEIPEEEDMPASAEELDFNSAEETGNRDWGSEKKTVICKNCGAEIIYDALDVANKCPYCDSNQVMEAHDKDSLAPGGVIPFQITDEEASARFKKWINRKWFCPKVAKQTAQPDRFKGIYLPYWTYDTQTETYYRAQYGIDRHVTGKDGKSQTVTDWYRTSGNYSEFIDDQLVLASSRHNASMLKGLEPFQTSANKSYKPEYVAGYVAERYSIGLKDGWETAKKFIQQRLNQNINSTIRRAKNADRVRNLTLSTVYKNITYKYLMLPVWCSNFSYNGKIYQFMVNGQTGKVSGKTPISALKVAIAVGAGLIVLALIFWLTSGD